MTKPPEDQMDLDVLHGRVAAAPEKVVDAFRELCDHHYALLVRISKIPLGTQAGVVQASMLQGEAQALESTISTLYEKLSENEKKDTEDVAANPSI